MELVFNELSLRDPSDSVIVARQRMCDLVFVIRDYYQQRLGRDLRVSDNFIYEFIGKDYKIIQWLNDQEVDIELKRFFKASITRKPYIDPHMESHLYSSFQSSEFQYKELKSKGLGIAYLLNGTSISLQSNEEWNSHSISLSFVELDQDGEIYEDTVSIRHISNITHINIHKPYYDQLKKIKFNDLEWRNNLEQLFPSLVFCDRAIAQLFEFQKGELILGQIKNKLIELNEYFDAWDDGGFKSEVIASKVTPESQRTLEQFAKEHTFLCPDGEYRVFSWHLRMTPGAGRIFFIPEEKTRKCIIGHIGNKLKTVNDRT
ncbi:hypothetical protein ABEO75_09760 [Paenibacillus macerans]|uniref:hypothetical protein n=1 Tax=Paenibacillus macerans TaxID=44252 RepID=UPI002E1CB4A7|nr:hypothetical protein [Paenibacillus macerans]